MTRTQFMRILEKLDFREVSKLIEGISKDEYEENMKKTLAILKEHDAELKRELEAKPTLKVFVKEQEMVGGRHIFKFEHHGKRWTFDSSDFFWFFKDSAFMDKMVVVSYDRKTIKEGNYINEANWSFTTYEYNVILGKKEDYDNVRTEVHTV